MSCYFTFVCQQRVHLSGNQAAAYASVILAYLQQQPSDVSYDFFRSCLHCADCVGSINQVSVAVPKSIDQAESQYVRHLQFLLIYILGFIPDSDCSLRFHTTSCLIFFKTCCISSRPIFSNKPSMFITLSKSCAIFLQNILCFQFTGFDIFV